MRHSFHETVLVLQSPYIGTCLFGKQYLQVIALFVEGAVDIDLPMKAVKRKMMAQNRL